MYEERKELKWVCTFCGKESDYHLCYDGIHEYFCDECIDETLGFRPVNKTKGANCYKHVRGR